MQDVHEAVRAFDFQKEGNRPAQGIEIGYPNISADRPAAAADDHEATAADATTP